ncbi:MAG: prolipoprotein diacylglyceryl transferase [Chloroflexi bacterium]|nr:prolipoprotein diacylglyceryl transferase [Chloroflexota bacterium]
MYPELLHLGGLTIRSYTLMIEIGLIVGLLVAYKEARRLGFTAEQFIDLAIWVVVAAVVGTRLYYVAINWPEFEHDWWGIIRTWEGGLVFHGALLGGLLAAIIYVHTHRLPFWPVADFAAPGLILGQAIGRIGCFLNGCCYGVATTLPWGVTFPWNAGERLQPTQLYESAANFGIFAILWGLRKNKPWDGFLFVSYLILYSSVRFTLEFVRGDPAQVFDSLRLAQWVSLALLILGIGLGLYRRSKAAALREASEGVSKSS